MKRILFLAAAMTPLIAVAGGGDKLGVKAEELKDDLRLSEIIGSDAQSSDGQTVGEVEDVVIGSDGRVESLLVGMEGAGASGGEEGDLVSPVSVEGAESGSTVAQTEPTSSTTAVGQPTEPDNPGEGMSVDSGSGSAVPVQWSESEFDKQNRVVTLSSTPSELQAVSSESSAASDPGKHKASELMDMEVALSDEESFGDVEDVLVSSDGKVSAVVVNAGGFMSEEQYALPADFENINAEEGTIRYDFARADVESQAKIDLEQLQQSAGQDGQ